MYAIAEDLEATLTSLLSTTDPERLVVIEEAPEYPGELIFQLVGSEQAFYSRYRKWVSRYCVLNELYNLDAFVAQLSQDGWEVIFGPSCESILANYQRWSEPLKIKGYDLHGFQQFSLNRAFEQRFWFFNWSCGTGKSFVSAVGAKELFRRGEIDLVLAFTLSKFKINQQRYYQNAGLDVVVNDGTRAKRTLGYQEAHQGFILNYEKAWVDNPSLTELVAGKRVLYILDECHRVVTDGKPNKARQAIDKLQNDQSRMWPMSASVVNGNPLRFRDAYSLDGHPRLNPLGSKTEFERRYADKVKHIPIKTRTGGRFELTTHDWNLGKLQEIRHRVGDRTQVVRKTDPGVREYFKGLATIVEPVQMSNQDRELTDIIVGQARDAWNREENLGPYYRLLRYTCNTAEALLHTQDDIGREIAAAYPALISSAHSTKLEMLNDKLEEIQEQGDKVVVFTAYTNLGLHLITPHVTVPHVVHYGVGQSARESQEAQDRFKADHDITAFMTSDAGSHALNMQEAKYCISYEPTYSYDLFMQRCSRIDRSDSHLDGLTALVYITENSVEERIWSICNTRREISAVAQGTDEGFSHGDPERERSLRSEAANLAWLIFGNQT